MGTSLIQSLGILAKISLSFSLIVQIMKQIMEHPIQINRNAKLLLK